jgi:hypothetical protein
LYYYAFDGRLMAVPISATTTLEVGTAVPLFTAHLLNGPTSPPGFRAQYDVTHNGDRFLLNVPEDDSGAVSPTLTLIDNWMAMLRK